ncbi:MAG TPA: ABC transporter substrate-binding protein [Bordetella sp.]
MPLKPSHLIAAIGLAISMQAAHAAGTLIYCSEASPEGFDIAQFTTGTTNDAAGHTVYNRLVDFKKGTLDLAPSLAQSWDISPDGLAYTFHLRKGVKFQTYSYFKPTRDFDADDVVFTYTRLINKDAPFNKAYPAQFPYANDTGLVANVVSIDKVDDYTVKFTLKTPDADLVAKMALPSMSILSAEYADKLLKEGKADMINQQPVGTGPFVLVRYEKDAQLRYRANKEYWNPGVVKLDNLIFAITPDASVRAQKLKANECQIAAYPKPQDLADLAKAPNLKMMEAPGFNIGYLAYNNEKPQLKDVRVRQALDMAINRKAILDAVYQGQGQEAANPYPPSLWGYNAALRNPPMDIEKAKKLLADAGYPNGFELSLWALPVQRPYNPNGKLMAEMIQSDWAKIGVKANIVTYEWGEYLKRMKNGEFDAGLMGWTGDYASPDNFLGVLLSCAAVGGSNYSRWCDKDFDTLVVGARAISDQSKRAEMYSQAQAIFKQQVPWSTIAHSTTSQPLAKNVEGYAISPLGRHIFEDVSIK